MRLADVGFFVRQAVHAFVRGLSVNGASVISVGLSLIVLVLMLLVWFNVELLVGAVRSEAEVVAYLAPDVEDKHVETLQQQVLAMSGVIGVVYVDPDQAQVRMQQLFGDVVPLDALEGVNPFTGYMEIAVVPEAAGTVAAAVRTLSGIEAVRDNEEIVSRLLAVARYARYVGAALALAVLFMTTTVVAHIIRLGIHARRRDIDILRLLGADEWYVGAPFVIEAVLISSCGGAVSLVAMLIGLPKALGALAVALPFIPVLDWSSVAWVVVVGVVCVSGVCGLVGGVSAVRGSRR